MDQFNDQTDQFYDQTDQFNDDITQTRTKKWPGSGRDQIIGDFQCGFRRWWNVVVVILKIGHHLTNTKQSINNEPKSTFNPPPVANEKWWNDEDQRLLQSKRGNGHSLKKKKWNLIQFQYSNEWIEDCPFFFLWRPNSEFIDGVGISGLNWNVMGGFPLGWTRLKCVNGLKDVQLVSNGVLEVNESTRSNSFCGYFSLLGWIGMSSAVVA